MSIKILQKKLLQIISKEMKIDINKLDLNKSANDFVEWDSLSNVRLILRIQKEFKINIRIYIIPTLCFRIKPT